MSERGTFKGKEVVCTIKKLTDKTEGDYAKEMSVSIEKVRPIFSSYDGPDTKGRPQIDVVLTRGKGKFSLKPDEAEIAARLLAEVVEDAKNEKKRLQEEQDAWQKQQSPVRREGGGSHRRTGKTDRQRAKGKAGHAAHRARKAEISQKSREINQAMGQISKK